VLIRRGWWDEQEEHALRLNPFVARVLDKNPSARRATITTPACNGRTCPVVWQSVAQRSIGSTRFVNLSRIPFILNHTELNRMAEEIADWSPQFLDVDPVHGAWLVLHCERQNIRFPTLKFVLCSYEFVSVVHHRILQRAFGVPVFNLYGSTETGHLLMEDEDGEMKPSYENAFLEVVEPDARGIGDLVVTTLTNDFMLLLRYRIGDLVERREQPYRTRYIVHGRSRDALRDGDGRHITTWEVDQCFAGIEGMAHYQLRQEDNGECRLRFVPDGNGLVRVSSEVLVARLESLLKLPGKIAVEAVNLLPPAPSGKFRLTYHA
jgi:phenylacetate-coenzyme A ligase PaaK-like adenylate-forming protein